MQNKAVWPRVRKLFMDVHLWLGLSSGLVVVAICFSGTIYVWNTELTEWAAPHLYKVERPNAGERIAADSLASIVKNVSGGNITSAVFPSDASRTYQFQVKKKGDSTRGTTYYINPYTGAVTGTSLEKTATKTFLADMFSLHRWLLLDKIGKRELGSAISGWATIVFTLGCITGLVIWFPRKIRNWKQGLKIKYNASWKRVNHDLHNSLAFYALIFLLLMGLTGPQWSFPWYRKAMQQTLGTYKPEPPKQKKEKKEKAEVVLLPMQAYLNSADSIFTDGGDYTVNLPAEGSTTVMVNKTRRGFFAPAAADRLTLDAATAKVIKEDMFRNKPFNERVAGSIKAIHVGNVYGTFTKILYFLACLIATSLPVTGTLIWINKLKQRGKKPSRTNQSMQVVPQL